MIRIRPAEPSDAESWRRMRLELWAEEPAAELARDVDGFFAGRLREPAAVLIALEDDGAAAGFVELSIRAYAEGCRTSDVAYVEGWYVAPRARGLGVGRALIAAAEAWARERGCEEIASDSEVENAASAAAHLALGFEEAGIVRCFRKELRSEGEKR